MKSKPGDAYYNIVPLVMGGLPRAEDAELLGDGWIRASVKWPMQELKVEVLWG